MRNKMQKALPLVLVLNMVPSVVPAMAFAKEAESTGKGGKG